jgi:hypothetical protein
MRSAVVSFLGTHALPQDTDVFRTIVGHNRVQIGETGRMGLAVAAKTTFHEMPSLAGWVVQVSHRVK